MSDTNMSFDDFVKQGRKRVKAQKHADDIFGKKQRSDTQSNNRRQDSLPIGGSLTGRMGVNKRVHQKAPTSASHASPRDYRAERNADRLQQQQPNDHSPRLELFPNLLQQQHTQQQTHGYSTRQDLFPEHHQHMNDNLNPTDLFPGRQQQSLFAQSPHSAQLDMQKENSEGISIRGAAGPFCVVASNFAPGTTVADVVSVMQPIGGEMISCKLVAADPSVTIELVFVNKAGAEKIVSKFNNILADGIKLHVYIKKGGPTKPLGQTDPQAYLSGQKSPLNVKKSLPVAQKSVLGLLAPNSDSRSVAHSRSGSNPSSGTLSLDPSVHRTPRDNDAMKIDGGNKSSGRIPTGPRATRNSPNPDHFGRAWTGPPSRNVRRDHDRRRERNYRRDDDNIDFLKDAPRRTTALPGWPSPSSDSYRAPY